MKQSKSKKSKEGFWNNPFGLSKLIESLLRSKKARRKYQKSLSKPRRIQRKRIKGWKMPKNTVYVGRGSKWGNPFKIGTFYRNKAMYILLSNETYTDMAKSLQVWKGFKITRENCLELYKKWFKKASSVKVKAGRLDITELKGKNLACWCSLNEPCHADILLKLANK